jgi:hypothetical protein
MNLPVAAEIEDLEETTVDSLKEVNIETHENILENSH